MAGREGEGEGGAVPLSKRAKLADPAQPLAEPPLSMSTADLGRKIAELGALAGRKIAEQAGALGEQGRTIVEHEGTIARQREEIAGLQSHIEAQERKMLSLQATVAAHEKRARKPSIVHVHIYYPA